MIDWENLSTGLTLPEAIRKGAEGRKKAHGRLFEEDFSSACALGSAFIGIVGMNAVRELFRAPQAPQWGEDDPNIHIMMALKELYGDEVIERTWKANDGAWRDESLESIADRIEAGELTEWVIAEFEWVLGPG